MIKNCFFEDIDISFTAEIESLIESTQNGYYMKIKIPKSYVKELFNFGIYPFHKSANYWVLKVKLNNLTKVMLNGKLLSWYGDGVFSDIPVKNIRLNELVLKRYTNQRMKDEYQCSCYATRVTFREVI